MAENKKSFILYCDLIHEVDHLTDEEKGKLFQHLLEYVNDLNPVMEDRVLLGSWKHIERQLKRDLRKYEEIREKRREAGAKGGKQTQAKQANASFDKQTQANQAVTDTVNVNVNDTVNVSSKEDKNAARFYFQNQELNDVFSKWLKMLSERGKPMASASIEALQMKLNRQSEQHSIKQVTQSLEKGWLNLRAIEEIEKTISAQEAEDMDIAILKHMRDVQSEIYNNQSSENNRMRRIS